jgi:alpha-glucosidase/alpha-D-xyloside xylohydrolase
VDLATMPIYVRAGAIVPLDPVRQYTGQPVSEPTTLQVHRGADGRFALYDDDGKSLGYLRGQGSWTRITWDDSKSRLVIEPDDRSASRAQTERTFEIVVFPNKARQRVKFAGKRVEVGF